jgi:hypothetical protein
MRISLKHIHQHAVLRILCFPAYIFTALLLIKLAQTPEVFWEFLRSHKGAAIFSLILIMTHTTQEFITALEDYIPNFKRRTHAIKITIFLSAASVVIIGFALWRV